MSAQIFQILEDYHVGDIASVLGLLVSVGGFIWTLIGVWRSKNAAEAAEISARAARDSMNAMKSIVDLSAILGALQDLKTLHRLAAWSVLLERYGTLRASLVALRASRPQLDARQRSVIQGVIHHLSNLETTVDRLLATSGSPPDISRINTALSDQIDMLTELLIHLQHEEVSHG